MNTIYLAGEIDNLEQRRTLISSKLNKLKKQLILETRAEEKFRLEQLIQDDQAKRDAIDQELEVLRNKGAEPKQSSPAKPGTLFGVPNLPPNYLERDDNLKEVRAALLAKETRRQHVGVLGMGGLGKSVLAAALARDKDVRAAFPDGIFWLTFGQRPDEARLLELQASILRHIPPGQQPESLDHGATLLSLALEDRRCLLIADDLWDSRHLRHFPLGGDGSRFLLTTRDAEVIRKIGAHRCQIGLLSDQQARKLLAECSGYDENALPDEAAVIVQECGHLPLAIAAVGSMVMDESADFWQIVLKRLQTARLDKIPANVTIDYEHKNLFKVFHISVDTLPQEVQAYYKTLLVFPEDAQIPQSVLQLYWKHNCLGDYEPLEIISILVKRSLFTKVNDEFFTLHDLLRDYLVFQYGRDNASMHKQLLEAYKAKYSGGWHTIPYEEPYYFHNYWHVHVQAAGEIDQLGVIADDLIQKQPLLNQVALKKCLEFVDYQLADIAPYLLKISKHSHVIIACLNILGDKAKEDARRFLQEGLYSLVIIASLKILGDEAKEDARRLIKDSQDAGILFGCLNILGDEGKEDAKILLKKSENVWILCKCLNMVGYEAKEDARRFLHEGQHPHVLSVCLNILGWEAKEDARRLIKESNDAGLLCACLNILGWEAKEDARRLIKESNDAGLLCACLNILGWEAKEDARRLIKESNDAGLLCACLKILDWEAKEDARRLIKESNDADIIATCLKILGDDAKDDAKRLLRENNDFRVITVCLTLIGDEAKDDARRILKEREEHQVITVCLGILGDEAKDDARLLLKKHNDAYISVACLKMLGEEAKDDAKRLLKESKDITVLKACLKILGEEAKDDAKRLLKESKDEAIIKTCLYLLGNEAKKEARRLLKASNDEIILIICIEILGKEAEADANRLIKTTKSRSIREGCQQLIFSWKNSLGSKFPELDRLKKNDTEE